MVLSGSSGGGAAHSGGAETRVLPTIPLRRSRVPPDGGMPRTGERPSRNRHRRCVVTREHVVFVFSILSGARRFRGVCVYNQAPKCIERQCSHTFQHAYGRILCRKVAIDTRVYSTWDFSQNDSVVTTIGLFVVFSVFQYTLALDCTFSQHRQLMLNTLPRQAPV